jgi:hypothetical protein
VTKALPIGQNATNVQMAILVIQNAKKKNVRTKMHAVLVLNHFVEYYKKKCCKTARKHVADVLVRTTHMLQKEIFARGVNGRHVLRLVEMDCKKERGL